MAQTVSNIIRDFTDEKRAELESQIRELESENKGFFNFVGDRLDDLLKGIKGVKIDNYLDNISDYHRLILDIRNTTLKQLREIFNAVHQVDVSYNTRLSSIFSQLFAYKTSVSALAGLIEPNASNGMSPFSAPDFLIKLGAILSNSELLRIDPEYMTAEQREMYFNELLKRLTDPNLDLTDEQREKFNEALGNMTLEERMNLVFGENGEYGGNQSDPAIMFLLDPDFQEFMRNLLPGLTDAEIRVYLDGQRDVFDPSNDILGYRGVGCGYMATANLILTEYANRPDEFEEIFGFPMYTCGADGIVRPNFERLAVTIYHHCGRDGRNGNEAEGIFPSDAIESYLSANGIDVSVSSIWSFPSINNIKNDLENGPVPLSLNPCIMYDAATGIRVEVGAHAIIITGVTDDGNLIVSSWGNQYIVHQSDYDSINRGAGEYVCYEATIFE